MTATLLKRGAPAAMAAALVWTPTAQAAQSVADLAERVAPSVVTVLAEHDAPEAAALGDSPLDDFLRRFGAPRGQAQPHGQALGSGFVIEADGYIVTNNHVVEGADAVTIRMPDEREYEAEILGVDPRTDLALLKVEAEDLPALPLGDSDALRVGEDVVAVGNPFGLGGTVTRGIVSAIGRDIPGDQLTDFIQTDAAINRGNSGGPLLNMAGEVIGVNTAIFSPSGGSVGVGFAVPSEVVKSVTAQLRQSGAVSRGWLGVRIQSVSEEIAEALGLDLPQGALVAQVEDGAPADGALRSGDVILSFQGEQVFNSRDLPRLVAAARVDEDAVMEVLRDEGIEEIVVTLGKLPGEPERLAEAGADTPLGARLAGLTDETRQRLDLPEHADGALVTALDPNGAAARGGLAVGDVIVAAGGAPVHDPRDVAEAARTAGATPLLLRVLREGATLYLGLRLA